MNVLAVSLIVCSLFLISAEAGRGFAYSDRGLGYPQRQMGRRPGTRFPAENNGGRGGYDGGKTFNFNRGGFQRHPSQHQGNSEGRRQWQWIPAQNQGNFNYPQGPLRQRYQQLPGLHKKQQQEQLGPAAPGLLGFQGPQNKYNQNPQGPTPQRYQQHPGAHKQQQQGPPSSLPGFQAPQNFVFGLNRDGPRHQ